MVILYFTTLLLHFTTHTQKKQVIVCPWSCVNFSCWCFLLLFLVFIKCDFTVYLRQASWIWIIKSSQRM